MTKLTNAETRPLVAKALGVKPKDLIGWIVVGITDAGETLVGSNATNREWIIETVEAVAKSLPGADEV